MAKRFTDTEQWDKEWFMKLSPKLKCLVKLVRDKCDLCGVWSPNFIIASAYVGEPVNEQDLISINGGKQFQKLKSGKIFCIGFIHFQYGELSEKSPVHRKILSLLKTHKIGYQYPIGRVKEEDKEKEEVEDKDKLKEKVKEEVEERRQKFILDIGSFVPQYGKEMLNAFFQYWSEKNKTGTKMKFELQDTWDLNLRLIRWSKNNKQFSNGKQSTEVLRDSDGIRITGNPFYEELLRKQAERVAEEGENAR